MVITLGYLRETGKPKENRREPILGALRGLHKGIKRMGGMIKTHAEEFLLG
ncbi:hypothetical protein [Pseudomonas sp. LB3P25]